jgi:hypothetical protein
MKLYLYAVAAALAIKAKNTITVLARFYFSQTRKTALQLVTVL